MHKFFSLLSNEIIVQIKIYNLIIYFFSFFLFVLITVLFIYGLQPDHLYVVKLFLIFIPISLISSNFSFRDDIYNGHLEFLLTLFSTSEIILSKYCAICLCHFTISILNVIILFVFYSLNWSLLMLTLFLVISLVLLSEALFILIAVMQLYFSNYKNYLLTIIFPFMIPSFLFISILLSNPQNKYIIAVLSFILIMVPMLLLFANFMLKDVKI